MSRRFWILWRASSFFFHILTSLIFVYSLVYHELTRDIRFALSRKHPNPEPAFFGDWKYLTRWNFTIETVVFTTCMLIDVLLLGRICMDRKAALVSLETPLEKRHPIQRLVELIDTVIFSLGFPLAMFVSITFWALYALDPTHVTSGPNNYPVINHVMHTGVGIAMLLELVITYHKRPNHESALIILILFTSIFVIWVFFVHYKTNFWLYPIFGKLSPVTRALFMAGAVVFFFALYFLGHFFQRVRWTEKKILMFLNGPRPEQFSEMNVDLVEFRNRDRASSP